MKCIFFVLQCFLIITTFSTGQTVDSFNRKGKDKYFFDFCGIYTPILSNNFYGFSLDLVGYRKIFGTGIHYNYMRKEIPETFSFLIEKPRVSFYELSLIIQYDLLTTNRARIDVNLINGLASSRLGDNAIKVEHWFWWRYSFDYYTSKKIARNYYYLFEPGIDVSYRFYANNNDPDYYLTAKAKYRFLLGDSKFGATNQFSNYSLAIGIGISGF
jgi:hypothetical protein